MRCELHVGNAVLITNIGDPTGWPGTLGWAAVQERASSAPKAKMEMTAILGDGRPDPRMTRVEHDRPIKYRYPSGGFGS